MRTKLLSPAYYWFLTIILSLILVPGSQLWPAQNAPPSQSSRLTITAIHLEEDEHINLDGSLDEPAWQRAIPATNFLQKNPNEDEPATEQTEVYVLYDRNYLYLGIMLYDSNPDGIIAYHKQRDAVISTDDRFLWILYTFSDGQTAYFFETNPEGVLSDGLFIPGSSAGFPVNKSWDGIWDLQVVKGAYGWSAEVCIPFRTLNFDPSLNAWGINFSRTVVRKNEESLWSGNRRNQGLYRIAYAGQLTGLYGISQGRGLETKPFAVVGWRNMPEETDPTSLPTDVGFDLTYSVTPSLRAALTVNTDFAEAEVDQRRVNLTRFPIRYPEQRDFFLEGSSVFGFASSLNVNPYFSRRIGLVGGEPVPITYGVRLAGQAGRYELGLIQVQTGEHETTPAETFTIARVKRSLLTQSSLGFIYTLRATGSAEDTNNLLDNHTYGFDLDLNTTRFLGDKNLQLQGYLIWHNDPESDSQADFRDLSSHGIILRYPNDIWSGGITYQEFGNVYSPAVGFTSRNGYRLVSPGIDFTPRPESLPSIRQFTFGLDMEYLTDLTDRLETREINATLFGIRFESGDNLSIGFNQLYERLEAAFTIHRDDVRGSVVIPVGEYTTNSWSFSGRSATRRPVAGSIGIDTGEFWSGHRFGYQLGLTLRPVPGVSFDGDVERNTVWLKEGDFSTQLYRLSCEWHLTPRLSVVGNMQYDDVSEILGLYAKLRWIIHPDNDLYFVYTHNWLNLAGGLQNFNFNTKSQGVIAKVNYTFRF